MLKPYNHRIVLLKVKTDYILNNPYWIPNNFHILLILLLISSKNQKQWKEKCYSPLYHVIQPLKFIFLSYALVFLHKLAPTSTHLLKVTAYKNHPLLMPSVFLFEIILFRLHTSPNTSHLKILSLYPICLLLWQNSS